MWGKETKEKWADGEEEADAGEGTDRREGMNRKKKGLFDRLNINPRADLLFLSAEITAKMIN